jgi:hypothetical protein
MFQFGSGRLFVNPIGGNLAANPTPQGVLTVQDISVDISVTLKELVGLNQYPDDIAPGEKKVSGKFSFGRNDLQLFNNIFFADTRSTGIKNIVPDEGPTAIPTTPFQITVTGSATFATDLGVINASTGAPMQRVASSPATGQYSVASGIYTFATADVGILVKISYVKTVAASGATVQINNQIMGYGPIFELWLAETYQAVGGNNNGLHLYACRVSKFTQNLKNNDYMKPEIDFSAFANAAGQVGELFQVSA